jgi:Domain of unknown function (DUF4136)
VSRRQLSEESAHAVPCLDSTSAHHKEDKAVRTHLLTGLGAALLVGACSGISTSTDYDPSANFSQYATYSWLQNEKTGVDAITNTRIMSSVDKGLAARGLKKVDGKADLTVGYQVTTAQKKSYNTVNAGWGGGYGWGGWGMGMGTSTTYENTWEEGSLILGLFDAGTKNLVWTGTATAALDASRSPEERQQLVDDAVTKMLKDFPPGS